MKHGKPIFEGKGSAHTPSPQPAPTPSFSPPPPPTHRFDECVTKLRPFLKSCGYIVKKEVKFLPISGLSGANVLNEVDAKDCPWWKESYSKREVRSGTGERACIWGASGLVFCCVVFR